MHIKEEIKIQILKDINDKIDSKYIAKKYNVSNSFIRNLLKKNNLKWVWTKKKKYSINENYFDQINTSEKAYILGFIWADGHLTKDGLCLKIQLQEQDKNILEKIKMELDWTGPIHTCTRENKKYVDLVIWNKNLVKNLKKYGLNNDKTKNPQIPTKIDNIFFKDFLRGFIDGDGTVFIKKYTNRFVASINILTHDNLIEYLLNNIKNNISNFTYGVRQHHRTSYLKIINISGCKNTKQFLDWLYENASIYLDRKYQKYLYLLDYYSKISLKGENSLSRFRGVQFEKRTNKWVAMIKSNNINYYLGTFPTEEEAALAYNKKAIELHAGKAILNKIN